MQPSEDVVFDLDFHTVAPIKLQGDVEVRAIRHTKDSNRFIDDRLHSSHPIWLRDTYTPSTANGSSLSTAHPSQFGERTTSHSSRSASSSPNMKALSIEHLSKWAATALSFMGTLMKMDHPIRVSLPPKTQSSSVGRL